MHCDGFSSSSLKVLSMFKMIQVNILPCSKRIQQLFSQHSHKVVMSVSNPSSKCCCRCFKSLRALRWHLHGSSALTENILGNCPDVKTTLLIITDDWKNCSKSAYLHFNVYSRRLDYKCGGVYQCGLKNWWLRAHLPILLVTQTLRVQWKWKSKFCVFFHNFPAFLSHQLSALSTHCAI